MRVKIRMLTGYSINSLNRILNLTLTITLTLTKIRRDENILRSNLRKKDIRARHCLRLHLNIENLIISESIIEQSLKTLL